MKKLLLLFITIFLFINISYALECMDCHSIDMPISPPIYPAINTSFFGVHINVNNTDGGLTSNDCISCHYGASTSIIFHGPAPVLTYKCENCHQNGSVKQVYNHTINNTISVNAECYDCHNMTASLFKYNAASSAAHYTTKTTKISSCGYCHQNTSSIYASFMRTPINKEIKNHTSDIISIFPLHTPPKCNDCHGVGEFHGQNLIKPLPNSEFCNNCHSKDPTQKNKHGDKVECFRCHANTSTDIHSIKYVLPDGSYKGVNATKCSDCHAPDFKFRLLFPTANCITCHQTGLPKFSEAPLIATPLNHSDNPNSGSLWNGTQTSYWNNKTNCDYCHGNTTHELKALGKIEFIRFGMQKGTTNKSYWCANCHYKNSSFIDTNYSYNGTAFFPIPPNIFEFKNIIASDGTPWFNHTDFGNFSDAKCAQCHRTLTSSEFVHDVKIGGGEPDCIECHDIGKNRVSKSKTVNSNEMKKGVHKNLNILANSSLDPINKACWACHGNGTQPKGYPPEYKNPKKCGNDECHSLNQKYFAPVVYSHFKNASLNNNPENALNFNVTTKSNCNDCHINSVSTLEYNKNSTVSHYALADFPDTINCIYCHLNKDNSEKWGNANLINKTRNSMIELNREKNKFTLKEGEFFDIQGGFKLKLNEVSAKRDNALIELQKNGVVVDKRLVGIGNYTYEEKQIIDDSFTKIPVILLNITGIFKGKSSGFIQFEGFRLKRIHNETKISSCIACHISTNPEVKYRVIERVDDSIFYTQEFLNFSDKKSFNETELFAKLNNIKDTDKYIDINFESRKTLYKGKAWNISDSFSIILKDVNTKSDEVFISLNSGNYYYENIVKKGDFFEYSPNIKYPNNKSKNTTIFKGRVSEIAQNMTILEEVLAVSPEIKKIKTNETILGYNTSWLWENDTFFSGKIPKSFHSPLIFDEVNGGKSCISCHGNVKAFGRHELIKGGCSSCHGGSEKHTSIARKCNDCHALSIDNYSATYIGDEEHKNEKCENCHISDTHYVIRFQFTPTIKNPTIIEHDNKITLKASANAGYKMKIRGARYYIDLPTQKFDMLPVDGVFDSQNEEIFAEINVSSGTYAIYIEAMERNNKWGTPITVHLEINNTKSIVEKTETKKSNNGLFYLIGIFFAFILRKKRKKVDGL